MLSPKVFFNILIVSLVVWQVSKVIHVNTLHLRPEGLINACSIVLPLTVTFLWKCGPKIPSAHGSYRTVAFRGCKGVCTMLCQLSSLQMRQVCLFRYPFKQKWDWSLDKIFLWKSELFGISNLWRPSYSFGFNSCF